jgi:hypothetical protein
MEKPFLVFGFSFLVFSLGASVEWGTLWSDADF